MTTLHESTTNEEFAEGYGDEHRTSSEAHCFNFTCFGPVGLEYRQLLHEDCAKEKGSFGGRPGQREKEVMPESAARARWKAAVHEIGRHGGSSSSSSSARRRRRSFGYDSKSYALNFDEGDCVGARIKTVGVDAARRI